MQSILEYMQRHVSQMTQELQEIISMESPSTVKSAVDALGRHLASLFTEGGATVDTLPRAARGDILRLQWGEGREEGQSLVLCHMDTVFAIGELQRNPVRLEGDRLYGPGASDMKGGIIILRWALRCMRDVGITPRRQVVGLITTDEEVGSAESRSIIEEEASRSAIALVTEPAMPPTGALKTWRKGTAGYRLSAKGRPAHAGADITKGINAVEELAHQIVRLQGLTNLEIGTTVNVGVISGGSRSNVVPEEASAEIDVRFMSMEEAARIDEVIRGLQPVLPGASLTVTGGVNRPPMVRNEATVALFTKAQALASELGFAVDESGTGGGSDGNFTSGVGCPTLDGMGVAGDGLHTSEEYALPASLPKRAALLVRLLQEG